MHPLHEPHSFEVASDVTLQQNDVKSGGTRSFAISTKTNVQWKGRQRQQKQRRIYTSTPKNEFNKQRKSQQSNDAIGLCRLAKATAKRFIVGAANSVKGQESKFNARLKTLILLFGILIIGHKIIILTMPYINASSVQQLSNYVQTQLSVAFDWSEENQLRGKLIAVLFGLFVTVFGCGIIYFDSAVPGVLPPSPFSKQQRSRQKNYSLHLNYLCALVAGATFTYFMYSD